MKRWVLALLAMMLIMLFAGSAAAQEDSLLVGYDRVNTYANYLRRLGGAAVPGDAEIILRGEDVQAVSGQALTGNGYAGKAGVVDLVDGDATIAWTFDVQTAGLYAMELTYFPMQGYNGDIIFALTLDGQTPYNEALSFSFSRMWRNATEIVTDNRGNELRPSQMEAPMWLTRGFMDAEGATNGTMALYLTEGTHTLALQSTGERVVIEQLRLYPPQELPAYAEYREGDLESKTPSGYLLKLQAEDAQVKSDASITPLSDRSSPYTEPYHHANIRMNVLGGTSWQYIGQTVQWSFEVPESGYYCISMRYLQNYVRGFFTSRDVLIDGECLFTEMQNVRFPYGNQWQLKTLGDDEVYEIYLTAGEHTLSMVVTLGDMANSFRRVDDAVFQLNAIYRKIVMVTGADPDPYIDYMLEREIPDLVQRLTMSRDMLVAELALFEEVLGSRGSEAATLERLIVQIESFLQKPFTIPERLKTFRENISSLASWLLEVRYQPLQLDYILIHARDAQMPRVNANAFESLLHEARSFGSSFTNDYNSIGDVYDDGEQTTTLTVWVSSGRDQAQAIKTMVDDMFTPRTGIQVNVSLVQGRQQQGVLGQGALVQAILTGHGPDIALGVGRGEPVNMAMRGALLRLDDREGYDEIVSQYMDGAMVPYMFDGDCYALPETQDFHMLFYRKDILDELGIKPPTTWEEFYKILPIIQRNNMEVGLPYRTMTAYELVYYGMGGQSILPALLFQRGGSFFTGDMTASGLNTPEGIEAFKEWTQFYTDYGLPVFYDFVSRFRSGEMPLAIASYTSYNMLSVIAPEIRNLWGMTLIPGTPGADGTIDRSEAASGTACIIVGDTEYPDEAWAFLKWWTSAEVQTQYGHEMEMLMGPMARYNPANLAAFAEIGWTRQEESVIRAQWAHVREVPEVPGGYYMSRSLDNAFREVEMNKSNPRETLYEHMKQVDSEIERKRVEFGLAE